jgi:hypothetical protein
MFSTLSNLLRWSTIPSTSTAPPSVESEWATWLEWQQRQPPSHYEKSDIFQYYLTYHPGFQPPVGSVIKERCSGYYRYCFGDFAAIIVNPEPGSNAIEYFSLLLDIYDTCKGITRRLTGDPVGISLLRQVIQRKSLSPLFNHDFNDYAYNYAQIHAHTVSQYSLSTLIMRFVSNYMSQTKTREYYPFIMLDVCQKAYDNCVYGEPRRLLSMQPSSAAVAIKPSHRPVEEESRAFSWPRDISTCLRCRKCLRITENIYGSFSACLDCHMKRICSICGDQAVIIGGDELPKCYIHQTMNLDIN